MNFLMLCSIPHPIPMGKLWNVFCEYIYVEEK